jgi:hypothetical protein
MAFPGLDGIDVIAVVDDGRSVGGAAPDDANGRERLLGDLIAVCGQKIWQADAPDQSPAERAAPIGSRNDHAVEIERPAKIVRVPRQALDLGQALGIAHCHDTVLVVADGKANAATARAPPPAKKGSTFAGESEDS